MEKGTQKEPFKFRAFGTRHNLFLDMSRVEAHLDCLSKHYEGITPSDVVRLLCLYTAMRIKYSGVPDWAIKTTAIAFWENSGCLRRGSKVREKPTTTDILCKDLLRHF